MSVFIPSRVDWRKVVVFVIGAVLVACVVVAGINWWMIKETRGAIAIRSSALHQNSVAIVLGTAPTIGGGRWRNPFFEGRMDAAVELFRDGKVAHLLVSGDNSRKTYDEPSAMRDALIARGVPESAITLDYAGFRTLDTMARARAVFGQRRVTVITDDFHLPRSLFLARAHGLDAVGYSARPVPWTWSKKTRCREVVSRVKAWLDVYVLKTNPKFYGPPVHIDIALQQ
jgi:SanA protein